MRRTLAVTYGAGLVGAAFFLLLIAVVILAQIIGRFWGVIIPSADEIAAFSMAASIFLGLAATLRAGGHVRVELLLARVPRRVRLILNFGSYLFAAIMLGYLSWHTVSMTWTSFVLGDRSPGLLSIPLWLPQAGMSAGLILLALACIEGAVDTIVGREPSPSRDAVTTVRSE